MKKKLIQFLILILVVSGSYIFFTRYFYLLNSQPHLPSVNYPKELDTIRMVRKNLKSQGASTTALEKKFVNLMTKRIFPYWYGTKWNFHGTTQTPNEGSIACGYFVTTTLRDIGVPLNRVKLAQCASEEMITTLTSEKNIYRFSNTPIEEFEKQVKKYGKGLYIAGLDKHTGFILLSDEGSFFIHSSGMFPFQVIKENLKESTVLKNSKYKVIGKISSDKAFLKRWIENNKAY